MKLDSKLPETDDCLYRISVKALITNNDRVLLVKEQDDEWWNFPGGGMDYGESGPEALQRELLEELGIEKGDIESNYEIIHLATGSIEGRHKANLFYRVKIPIENIKPTADVEQSGWFTCDELLNMYLSPSTGDSKELISEIRKFI